MLYKCMKKTFSLMKGSFNFAFAFHTFGQILRKAKGQGFLNRCSNSDFTDSEGLSICYKDKFQSIFVLGM